MRINAIQNYTNHRNKLKQNNKVSFGEIVLSPEWIDNVVKYVPSYKSDDFLNRVQAELNLAGNINLRKILYNGLNDVIHKKAVDRVVDKLGDDAENFKMTIDEYHIYAEGSSYHYFTPFICNIKLNHLNQNKEPIKIKNLKCDSAGMYEAITRYGGDILVMDNYDKFANYHITTLNKDSYNRDLLNLKRDSFDNIYPALPKFELIKIHLLNFFNPSIKKAKETIYKEEQYKQAVNTISPNFIKQ